MYVYYTFLLLLLFYLLPLTFSPSFAMFMIKYDGQGYPPLFFQISRSHAHFKIVGKIGLRDLTLDIFLISFIKNVNSFTSNKITPSSFRESKKILPSTFIYESISIYIYINTNNMQTQLFIKNVGSSIFYKKSTGLCD